MSRQDFGTENIVASQNALSTTAEQILALRPSRHRAVIKNTDGAITVYIGATAAVTSTTGMPIAGGESVALYYRGVLYAIAASGTPTVAIIEEY